MIAIIPARKNSKRFPRKNHASYMGRSLLQRTFECALASQLFEDVYLSTDDLELADKARKLGILVPHIRPANLGLDHTSSWAVIEDFVVRESYQGDLALLQLTSPLREPQDLTECANKLKIFPERLSLTMRFLRDQEESEYWVCPHSLLIDRSPHCETAVRATPNGACYMISTQMLEDIETIGLQGATHTLMPLNRSLDIDFEWQVERNGTMS